MRTPSHHAWPRKCSETPRKVKKIMKAVTGSEGKMHLSGESNTWQKRPLLVSFKNCGDEEKFMDNLKNLKGTEFSNVTISHDLTQSQRQQLKKLRMEAKHKQETELGDWVYRVVGRPSRWTVRKLKRRTQPQTDQSETNTHIQPPEYFSTQAVGIPGGQLHLRGPQTCKYCE